MGYATAGYQRYAVAVPKETRIAGRFNHPATPDHTARCAKRTWDSQVRRWRRTLLRWDPKRAAAAGGAAAAAGGGVAAPPRITRSRLTPAAVNAAAAAAAPPS